MDSDLFNEGCLDCGRGLCQFCKECKCCRPESKEATGGGDKDRISSSSGHNDNGKKIKENKSDDANGIGRPIKEPGDIKDKKSTGRKRAAIYYPLSFDKPCEWRNLSNCGGGKFPIIGCTKGKQQHRHHGPDKDTLNNSPGNIHRICTPCHNIWHSQNDQDYDASKNHNPRPATQDELINRMMKITYVAE